MVESMGRTVGEKIAFLKLINRPQDEPWTVV
jgi:hypothetical protein